MKLAITLTMILLVSATLFLPCVRANVQVTSEFVDPVKNWSFEERDHGPPYPCDGVYECPPWESNSGGWRELRGDVDGNGICNIIDLSIIARAYGSYPGHPNWNPDADLNGDGVVNVIDTSTAGTDFGKTANRIDGYYSWYTNGGDEYIMWQWLDSDTVQAIAGKNVAFGFWFLPELVPVQARAEIHYEYNGGNNIVYGAWITATEINWTDPYVTAGLPSTTTAVKVVIHGKQDFKANIDLASLSITEAGLTIGQSPGLEMKMSWAVNLFEVKDYSLPVNPCRAFLGIATSANMSLSRDPWYIYYIDHIELEIKLIIGASVTIRNVTQSNNVNEITDPDQSEEFENRWAATNQIAIKALLAIAMWRLPGIGPYNIGNLLLSLSGLGATSLLLPSYRSDADTPYVDELGESAKARITYGRFPTFANERGILELAFNRGSSCQIEVTAQARFAAQSIETGAIAHLGTLEESTLVTVST